jgi:anthranilate synthase component 1
MKKRIFHPDFEQFSKLTKKGNIIPVYSEILADRETPVSAFQKMGTSNCSFLLESMQGGEKWARFSFIGYEPALVFRSKGKTVEVLKNGRVEQTVETEHPLDVLRDIMQDYQVVELEDLPRFSGGAVGYASYDMVKFIEDLPNDTTDDLNLYDSIFMITETILIFDNLRNTIKIVYNVHLDEKDENLKTVYQRAQEKIEAIISLLQKPASYELSEYYGSDPVEVSSNIEEDQFKHIVNKAKDYIKAGDIIQVVLSQRFETPLQGNPFNIYRALRRVNPSPYMYYLSFDDLTIVGASPEVLVRVEGDQIELRPIAGTRPRGLNEEEDEVLKTDLLSDPKEIAEHVMLVDLGRNDVGRVSTMGSVVVPEFLVIEKYSHVMHIVSDVRGTLKPGNDSFDVLKACFPAGTVSGAPKVRAMEIIEELEISQRGPYAGAVGYFSFSGNMDFCIVIRTILVKNNTVYFQVGAGIVADSQPENEFQETLNKGKAMLEALQLVREGLD